MNDNVKCWEGSGAQGTLTQGCWECKMVQPLGKSCVFYFLSFFKKKLFLFYQRMIALQNSVVFCQPSTWNSRRYTYIPSCLNLPPISRPSHLSRLIQSSCLSFLSHTANSRWLSILHMVSFHVTLCIHLTLSPLPMSINLFSMSVSLLLPCK